VFHRDRASVGEDRKFWSGEMMVAQCDMLDLTELYERMIKMLGLTLCIFYLNKIYIKTSPHPSSM
jgi:hypothetical protein